MRKFRLRCFDARVLVFYRTFDERGGSSRENRRPIGFPRPAADTWRLGFIKFGMSYRPRCKPCRFILLRYIYFVCKFTPHSDKSARRIQRVKKKIPLFDRSSREIGQNRFFVYFTLSRKISQTYCAAISTIRVVTITVGRFARPYPRDFRVNSPRHGSVNPADLCTYAVVYTRVCSIRFTRP